MQKTIIACVMFGIMIICSAVAAAQPLKTSDSYEFYKIGEGYHYNCHDYHDGHDYAPYGGCHRYR